MQGRIFRRVAALSLFAFVSLGFPAMAGDVAWPAVGAPEGGVLWDLGMDPTTHSTLYAAMNTGVFKTVDAGAHWQRLLAAPNGATDMAVSTPSRLYAIYRTDARHQIHRSVDGGATWLDADQGVDTSDPLMGVLSVTADSTAHSVAYISGNNMGVYKTTDGGQHWLSANTGFPTLSGNNVITETGKVVIASSDDQVLYAPLESFTTADAGIYKSADGGATWSQVLGSVQATSVTLDPADDNHLFASSSDGIYESLDAGVTWNLQTGSPLDAKVTVDPTDAQHLFAGAAAAGFWETSDGGGTWNPVDPDGTLSGTQLVVLDPVVPSRIYVGTSSFGILKSDDGGITWAASNAGLHGVYAAHMLMTSDGQLYIGTVESGLYRGSHSGADWTSANTGIAAHTGCCFTIYTVSMAKDPQHAKTLYVATLDGLYKTTDGAQHWQLLNNGLTDPLTLSVTVDPLHPHILFAGGAGAELSKSTDGGMSWAPSQNGLPSEAWSVAIDPVDDKLMYAGTDGDGLYRSTDGGSSWKRTGGSALSGALVRAVTVAPGAVYASVDRKGMFKSIDAGKTWTGIGTGLPADAQFDSIVADPSDPETLYLPIFSEYLVYVSKDGGMHWSTLNTGLPDGVAFVAMAFDPSHPSLLYAAGNDGQIYVTDTSQVTPPPVTPPSQHSGGGGGGGGFPSLAGLVLLGIGILRRRR